MIRDLSTAPLQAAPEPVDLCIVGGGAAGITLARALAPSGLRILLLESGGAGFEVEAQAFAAGQQAAAVGDLQPPGVHYRNTLLASRLRQLGGSTGHWGGWCMPLRPIDFAHRPWVPHSGWPIDYAALVPYYRQAQAICELGPFNYDDDLWRRAGLESLPLADMPLRGCYWQLSPPTRFARYAEALADHPDVHVWLHARVLKLHLTSDGGRVGAVALAGPDGRTHRLRAARFVLAGGGIENARLLLLSSDENQAGIGNGHDQVGRYFLEHPHVPVADVVPQDLSRMRAYFEPRQLRVPAGHARERIELIPALRLADARQQERGLLNGSVQLFSQLKSAPAGPGIAALQALRAAWRRGELPEDTAAVLREALRGSGEIAGAGWRVMRGQPARPRVLDWAVLFARIEQAPDPASRVRLGSERDPGGQPQAVLDWRLGETEWQTARQLAVDAAQVLAATGIARVRIMPWLREPGGGWHERLEGGNHHMGTTRMAASRRQGVVDSDCRVFGVANLYVAGSSVFPTGGFANPTLTLVALTLRLAAHLRPHPA